MRTSLSASSLGHVAVPHGRGSFVPQVTTPAPTRRHAHRLTPLVDVLIVVALVVFSVLAIQAWSVGRPWMAARGADSHVAAGVAAMGTAMADMSDAVTGAGPAEVRADVARFDGGMASAAAELSLAESAARGIGSNPAVDEYRAAIAELRGAMAEANSVRSQVAVLPTLRSEIDAVLSADRNASLAFVGADAALKDGDWRRAEWLSTVAASDYRRAARMMAPVAKLGATVDLTTAHRYIDQLSRKQLAATQLHRAAALGSTGDADAAATAIARLNVTRTEIGRREAYRWLDTQGVLTRTQEAYDAARLRLFEAEKRWEAASAMMRAR